MAVIRSLRAHRQARERFHPGFEVVDLNNLQFVRAVKAKNRMAITVGITVGVAFNVTAGITLNVTVGVKFNAAAGAAYSVAVIVVLGVTAGVTFSHTFVVDFGVTVGGEEKRALKSL